MNRKKRIRDFFRSPLHCVMTAVFFLVLILNILTVKTSDDLGYSIHNGLLDIFRREYIQYMTWTGRTVAHIFARLFLAMPKAVFNLCNSLLFVLHCLLIAVHAAGKKEAVTTVLYSVIVLAVFLFVPVFGQTVLWETGSCNYLWTTSIILWFLIPYRKQILEEKARNIKFTVLFFLAGIAAGWTNENTGGACILMVLCFLAYYRWKKISYQPWMFAGLAGACIGFLAMVLAPGNAIRSADFVNEGGKAYVLVHDLLNALSVVGNSHGQLYLWLIFSASLALLLACLSKDKASDREFVLPLCYGFCGIAAVGAIILSPVPVEFDRSMYGATIFVIIAMASLLSKIESIRWGKLLTAGLLGILSFVGLRNYIHALIDLSYTRYQVAVREQWVNAQRQAGNRNPVVPEIYSEFFTEYNAMYGLNDILESPAFVNNVNYAICHDLDSVTSTPLEKWNTIYRNGDPALMNETALTGYLAKLAEQDDVSVLVTSSELDSSWNDILKQLGVTSTNESGYLFGTADQGFPSLSAEPGGEGMDISGHYVWINASKDPSYCDILVDNVEYSNDREGITVAVVSKTDGSVKDSVTFDRDGNASRHYEER